MRFFFAFIACALACCVLPSCGDDSGTEADRLGVGAQCNVDDDCNQSEKLVQSCLSFKGGYCGVEGCKSDADCPEQSACVTHDDGVNYCFRVCRDKPECNVNRDADLESNCSSSVDFVDSSRTDKACVPPGK